MITIPENIKWPQRIVYIWQQKVNEWIINAEEIIEKIKTWNDNEFNLLMQQSFEKDKNKFWWNLNTFKEYLIKYINLYIRYIKNKDEDSHLNKLNREDILDFLEEYNEIVFFMGNNPYEFTEEEKEINRRLKEQQEFESKHPFMANIKKKVFWLVWK